MNRYSQIRMTNDEIRRNPEIGMTKPPNRTPERHWHSGFGFLSSFVIRRSLRPRSRPSPWSEWVGVRAILDGAGRAVFSLQESFTAVKKIVCATAAWQNLAARNLHLEL
jgi:hypothetical protein